MRAFEKLGLICFVTLIACSSAPQKGEHLLRQMLIYNLHVRRPDHVGAGPSAEPGELEYESHPLPNRKLDCVPLKSLFAEFNLPSVLECLSITSKIQQQPKVTISYLLRREPAPYLSLEEPERAPSCVKEFLQKIPVPREIFFQSNEEGMMNCYSSRLAITDDDAIGLGKFLHRYRVKISFPLQGVLESDEDILMLLGTWSITPFLDDDRNRFVSRLVPTEICERCMGGKGLFRESDSLPPLWPGRH